MRTEYTDEDIFEGGLMVGLSWQETHPLCPDDLPLDERQIEILLDGIRQGMRDKI